METFMCKQIHIPIVMLKGFNWNPCKHLTNKNIISFIHYTALVHHKYLIDIFPNFKINFKLVYLNETFVFCQIEFLIFS